MNLEEMSNSVIEYADISIPLRKPKGPWDIQTKKLIEEYNARYNFQQGILNNYARAEFKLKKNNDKKSKRLFNRASKMLWNAHIFNILPGKKHSWDDKSQKAIQEFDAKTDLEMFLIRSNTHIKYELTKEHPNIKQPTHINLNNSYSPKLNFEIAAFNTYQDFKFGIDQVILSTKKVLQKTLHFVSNDVLLAGITQGSLVNSLSAKMEEHITHISKKNAELANTVLSTLDHIPVILATTEISSMVAETTSNLYATQTAELTESSSKIFALGCIAWSVFRAGRNIYSRIGKNKDKEYKVLPSTGYGSGFVHSKHFLKTGDNLISKRLDEYKLKAKSLGTNCFYGGIVTHIDNFKNAYFKK